MADDMGYSDLGCYGGEIHTPNLDKLAENGIRFTQFYNTGRCCPTRASLLSGLYAHQTGMGWMTAANLGSSGYTGNLNRNCVTIAEVLKPAGYSTYMVGKWHVVYDKYMEPEGSKDNWPIQRGFDKYYGPINGGGSFFTTSYLTYGNERLVAPDDFYVTDAISDTATSFIDQHKHDKPFFMYVGYTAPHFPLHARSEDIRKYEGEYMAGWDIIRKKRYEKMIELGILESSWAMSGAMEDVPDWDELSQEKQLEYDRRMAVYAAQIDNMDQGIGRIVQKLRERKLLNNTIILFLSDNGGTAERIGPDEVETHLIGSDETYQSYRKPWATVSNTPFRMFKQWVHEGGISTPLIIQWPNKIKEKGVIRDQVGHVIDLMPTCLDLAKAEYPESFKNNEILRFEGISLVNSIIGNTNLERTLYFEHQATRAIRYGNWKLVADKMTNVTPYILDWELYNLSDDRSEINDLSEMYPEKVKTMDSLWNAWAKRCNVHPLDGRGWFERLEE
jgi:arylsulfatase